MISYFVMYYLGGEHFAIADADNRRDIEATLESIKKACPEKSDYLWVLETTNPEEVDWQV